MARTKQTFLASDDKEFDTELAADAHSASLKMADDIAEYTVAAKLSKAEATRASNYISGFAAYQASKATAEA